MAYDGVLHSLCLDSSVYSVDGPSMILNDRANPQVDPFPGANHSNIIKRHCDYTLDNDNIPFSFT